MRGAASPVRPFAAMAMPPSRKLSIGLRRPRRVTAQPRPRGSEGGSLQCAVPYTPGTACGGVGQGVVVVGVHQQDGHGQFGGEARTTRP
eukprot:11037169-Prorocentrum_lima.AAC.1